jgi:hypothetical protein
MVNHRIPELDKVNSRSYSEFCNLEAVQLASTIYLASGDSDCVSFPIASWVSAYHMLNDRRRWDCALNC